MEGFRKRRTKVEVNKCNAYEVEKPCTTSEEGEKRARLSEMEEEEASLKRGGGGGIVAASWQAGRGKGPIHLLFRALYQPLHCCGPNLSPAKAELPTQPA